jgi:hypothetical protein
MRVSFSATESANLLFESDFNWNSGAGMFGWCTFMKLMLMKNGPERALRSRYSSDAFSTYSSKNGMPTTPLSSVLTY